MSCSRSDARSAASLCVSAPPPALFADDDARSRSCRSSALRFAAATAMPLNRDPDIGRARAKTTDEWLDVNYRYNVNCTKNASSVS
eukprot:30942-Pelagococcus_subviridis.AAC.18